MPRKLLYLLLALLLLFLLLDPQAAFASSKNGLTLWFQTVLPSLLPFMILSNFIILGQGVHRLLKHFQRPLRLLLGTSPSGAYALILGLFCGYPMGAKLTADLYLQGRVSRPEACYLLALSNGPSPMFLTSYLAVGLLDAPQLAPLCLAAVYGGALLTGLSLRLAGLPEAIPRLRKALRPSKPGVCACALREENSSSGCFPLENGRQKEASLPFPLGKRIDASIMNGFEAVTKLGGYILMFSILSGLLKKLFSPFPALSAAVLGLTEISTGARCLAALQLPLSLKCSLLLTCAALGGASVAAQASSLLQPAGLPLKPYLLGKLCCGFFTLLLGLLLFVILL